MTDTYTKAVLTVIAAALLALVAIEYHQGWGARWVNIDYGEVSIKSSDMFPVDVKVVP